MINVIKVRQDIVLTKICGEYLLVATKSAKDVCPAVQHISKSAAFLWKKMQIGATIDELKEDIMEHYHLPVETSIDIEDDIRNLLKEMKKAGYLLGF